MNYQSYSSLILCSFVLSGCGQQGPLYMPIEEPPIINQPVEVLPVDAEEVIGTVESLNSETQNVIENTESLAPVSLEKPPVLATPESVEREESLGRLEQLETQENTASEQRQDSLERLEKFNDDVPPTEVP